MKSLAIATFLLLAYNVSAQDVEEFDLPPFECPESKGFFPDPEQCDLYYECVDGFATPNLCPDGLMFSNKSSIEAKCDYPHNVVCGDREYVQEREKGIDPRCYRANGIFNHEDENECNKFISCVYGVANEQVCATGLIFDEGKGICTYKHEASEYARVCKENTEKKEIDGFSCPDEETLGPHGQPLAHPTFPHPKSCQLYLICEFSKNLMEKGCQEGQVFDHGNRKCVDPENGTDDCKCWYECPERCTSKGLNCRSDCSCEGEPLNDDLVENFDN